MNSKIIGFAIEAHSKTNHLYDGMPYSVHLAMVANYAYKYFKDIHLYEDYQDTIISACWLHDTIEDCRLTYNDVRQVAGEDVAEIVYALTNEKGNDRKERASESYYKGIIATPFARYVKFCDRLANVRHSKDTKSRMLDVYRKENDSFLSNMRLSENELEFTEMINELNELLK